MNTLRRYIVKELFGYFFIVNIIIVTLMLVSVTVEYADILFGGGSASALFTMVVYYIPSLLVISIPVSSLFASMIAFNRISGDSEIVAMRSIGTSDAFFVKTIAIFGVTALLLSLSMSTYFMPIGNLKASDKLYELTSELATADIRANTVYDKLPDIKIYTENLTKDGGYENIVIVDEKSNNVTSAKYGYITTAGGFVKMLLLNGQTVVINHDGSINLAYFDKLSMSVSLGLQSKVLDDSISFMFISQLMQNTAPEYRFELGKRFALPLSSIVMALFGFSLGVFLKRSGKALGFVLSIALLFCYNSLFVICQILAGKGITPPFISAFIPLFLFGLIAVLSLKRVPS